MLCIKNPKSKAFQKISEPEKQFLKLRQQYKFDKQLNDQDNFLHKLKMIPSNNAIEVYRQRDDIHNLQPMEDITVPCMEASQTLRQCILKSNANVLDRADVESKCETREWRKSCTGEWRRRLVEGYYRELTNRQTYKQKDLDEYMRKRNNQFTEILN